MKLVFGLMLVLVSVLVGCELSPTPEEGNRLAVAAATTWATAMAIENPAVFCDNLSPYDCSVSDRAGHIYSLRCRTERGILLCTMKACDAH